MTVHTLGDVALRAFVVITIVFTVVTTAALIAQWLDSH